MLSIAEGDRMPDVGACAAGDVYSVDFGELWCADVGASGDVRGFGIG